MSLLLLLACTGLKDSAPPAEDCPHVVGWETFEADYPSTLAAEDCCTVCLAVVEIPYGSQTTSECQSCTKEPADTGSAGHVTCQLYVSILCAE